MLIFRRFVAAVIFLILVSGLGSAEVAPDPAEASAGCSLQRFSWSEDSAQIIQQQLIDCFAAYEIDDATWARMQGVSYKVDCPLSRSELRYLILPHFDGHGRVRLGELVCHADVAADIVAAFKELYAARYPIERMELIDDYGADDLRSMRANNTSCFNYRPVAGSKKLSAHGAGKAVDINPLYNPYVGRLRGGKHPVSPPEGARYADRTVDSHYRIERGDAAWRAFTKRGFVWGGAWRTVKDYQHFEKP